MNNETVTQSDNPKDTIRLHLTITVEAARRLRVEAAQRQPKASYGTVVSELVEAYIPSVAQQL